MYKKTYNPCDKCKYSFSKQNEVSGMCKICEFKNYIQAEEQGLLVRFPCKVGDKVFRCCFYSNRVDECKVSGLTQKADKSLKIRLTSGIHRGVFEITPKELGKTVFLTREDAEQALKERGSE